MVIYFHMFQTVRQRLRSRKYLVNTISVTRVPVDKVSTISAYYISHYYNIRDSYYHFQLRYHGYFGLLGLYCIFKPLLLSLMSSSPPLNVRQNLTSVPFSLSPVYAIWPFNINFAQHLIKNNHDRRDINSGSNIKYTSFLWKRKCAQYFWEISNI